MRSEAPLTRAARGGGSGGSGVREGVATPLRSPACSPRAAAGGGAGCRASAGNEWERRPPEPPSLSCGGKPACPPRGKGGLLGAARGPGGLAGTDRGEKCAPGRLS